MKTKPLVLTLSLFLLGACEKAARTRRYVPEDALATISQEALSAHLSYLADDSLEGREAGQPGYDLAAAYVSEQFAEMGLEPGGGDGWYQQVPLVTYLLETRQPENDRPS